MSDRDDTDAAASFYAGVIDMRLGVEPRALSGADVARVRTALEAAARALRHINTRGLVSAHRRDVEAARSALAVALPILARDGRGRT